MVQKNTFNLTLNSKNKIKLEPLKCAINYLLNKIGYKKPRNFS